MFNRSMDEKIRYKYLISDGDSKSHTLILEQQPYGSSCLVEKRDCIGHVQKSMGSALCELKSRYRGQKLSDGKTIGGVGCLTDSLINSLQNYYGDAIRKSVGDVDKMIKSVQATLLHVNSSDETSHHHLCPTGHNSWCKYQVAKARNETYHHKHPPIPEAIVQLLKPIYACLGSRSLLEKCVDGYTQNANESLHSVVWKLCPKVLHLGKVAVDVACALAVSSWNDGWSSIRGISERLDSKLTPFAESYLQSKDISRMKKARYKFSERAKKLRRRARRRRKGLEDKAQRNEGVVYAAGAFDSGVPGPSSQQAEVGAGQKTGAGKKAGTRKRLNDSGVQGPAQDKVNSLVLTVYLSSKRLQTNLSVYYMVSNY